MSSRGETMPNFSIKRTSESSKAFVTFGLPPSEIVYGVGAPKREDGGIESADVKVVRTRLKEIGSGEIQMSNLDRARGRRLLMSSRGQKVPNFSIKRTSESSKAFKTLVLPPRKKVVYDVRALKRKDGGKESPDMKFARTRLAILLKAIESGEIQTSNLNRARGRSPEDMKDELLGRVKKPTRRENRKMVFELRGKPFALRDTGRTEGVYALCRNWLRGTEQERGREKPEIEYPEPSDDSLDLLATRDIWALPRLHDRLEIAAAPPPLYMNRNEIVDTSNAEALLKSSLPHWRRIRRNWNEYSKIRDKRYEKSINLLKTVHAIARQQKSL